MVGHIDNHLNPNNEQCACAWILPLDCAWCHISEEYCEMAEKWSWEEEVSEENCEGKANGESTEALAEHVGDAPLAPPPLPPLFEGPADSEHPAEQLAPAADAAAEPHPCTPVPSAAVAFDMSRLTRLQALRIVHDRKPPKCGPKDATMNEVLVIRNASTEVLTQW